MNSNILKSRKFFPGIIFLIVLSAFLFFISHYWLSANKNKAAVVKTQLDEKALTVVNSNNPMYNIPDIPVDFLIGKTDPVSDMSFVKISPQYSCRNGLYMHKDAYEAFRQMHESALNDGVNLVIVSALRSFDHQKRIWNGKWNGDVLLHGNILATEISDPVERSLEILRFSAMPGTSRHHWGTDIDLNSLQNSYFSSGEGKIIYDWLSKNASKFGFYQPYTSRSSGREGGYEEEKWHWSYFPLSSRLMEAYKQKVTYNDITGFEGYSTARKIDVIPNFVMQVASIEY